MMVCWLGVDHNHSEEAVHTADFVFSEERRMRSQDVLAATEEGSTLLALEAPFALGGHQWSRCLSS